jgi:(4-(4-[2-(gamma-L-glutamylamino)ethyl]phenoxymethyl)furan-2-yl)methanamine synthase
MSIDLVGWDIGGAHLKAAGLSGNRVAAIEQEPCPLWQSIGHFHGAIDEILKRLTPTPHCTHVLTMTGELVDLFGSRGEGVVALIDAFTKHCPAERVRLFAGSERLLSPGPLAGEQLAAIASANWRATGLLTAKEVRDTLLVDVGSTTSDFLLIQNGELRGRGYADDERLRYDELEYCGVVRTPLMALAERVPLAGEWVGIMNEHFATTSDVYRLCGELPEHADQMPSADGRDKSADGSARRLARMVGRDAQTLDFTAWVRLARYFRERQLIRLQGASELQMSRGLLEDSAPLVGAGVGRFLVQELARRMGRGYLDFTDLVPVSGPYERFQVADCAPAVAVALLARHTS